MPASAHRLRSRSVRRHGWLTGLVLAIATTLWADALRAEPSTGQAAPPILTPALRSPEATNDQRASQSAMPPAADLQTAPSLLMVQPINPALPQASELITNSSLLFTVHGPKTNAVLARMQILLTLARQQRGQKNYTLAARHYVAILESDVPEEIHRVVLLELGFLYQEEGQSAKAQQIIAQYLKHWPDDPAGPELLLRQGLIYRQMGVPALALSKFYAVMTTALTHKFGNLDYYQKLVLHAQAEISDTYYLQGKFQEAAEFLARLLKQNSPLLNRPQIQFKLIRCYAAVGLHNETVAQASEFLELCPGTPEEPEVRFALASALKQLGQKNQALYQIQKLLQSQQAGADQRPAHWTYWQQRAGNEIANQLYLEGDYLTALDIYQALAGLNAAPAWQLPVLYQVGLVYERLQQPARATATYGRLLAREKDLASDTAPGLKAVLDMARWRMDFLNWQLPSNPTSQTNLHANAASPRPAAP